MDVEEQKMLCFGLGLRVASYTRHWFFPRLKFLKFSNFSFQELYEIQE